MASYGQEVVADSRGASALLALLDAVCQLYHRCEGKKHKKREPEGPFPLDLMPFIGNGRETEGTVTTPPDFALKSQ